MQELTTDIKPINYFEFYIVPQEMMINIFRFIPSDYLSTTIRLVCKSWKVLAEENTLWKQRVLEWFPTIEDNPCCDFFTEFKKLASGTPSFKEHLFPKHASDLLANAESNHS